MRIKFWHPWSKAGSTSGYLLGIMYVPEAGYAALSFIFFGISISW